LPVEVVPVVEQSDHIDIDEKRFGSMSIAPLDPEDKGTFPTDSAVYGSTHLWQGIVVS
jgi:peptide chain release factor 2